MPIIHAFVPTLDQALGLAAVLGTSWAFAAWGALAAGRHRFAAADIFVGWGLAVSIFILAGVLTALPFTWLAYGLFAGAVPAFFLAPRTRRPTNSAVAAWSALWRVLVLAAPLLILATAMRASQWDEFSQWLPNAQYILRIDAFPQKGLPQSPSVFPAYPYGLPIVSYLASKATGQFIENAGALFNVLLLLFSAVIVSHVIAAGLKRDDSARTSWGLLALSILGVTVLSTTFVQKIVLTSYADSATSATLAVIAVLLWKAANGLAEDSDSEETAKTRRALAWQCGLVIAVFLNLKQTNLVLLLLLLIGFAVVALKDPAIRVKRIGPLLPPLSIPGLLAYALWRYHVGQNMPQGEFSFMPIQQWHIADSLIVLWHMVLIAAKKAPFFIMMLTIAGFALYGFGKRFTPRTRLFIPVAVVFLGFNGFLWFTYIASFGLYDALRVGSYWRYNIQLGLLGTTAGAYGLALLWRAKIEPRLGQKQTLKKLLGAVPILCILILPFAAHHKLRFDIRPHKDHMRMVGQALAETLPPGSNLAVVDLRGSGFAGVVIRYETTSAAGAGRRISMNLNLNAYAKIKTADQLRARVTREGITHVWVHQSLPLIERAFDLTLAPAASHVLERQGNDWRLRRSWPYKGYRDPAQVPD
jgi:hypothetical protein